MQQQFLNDPAVLYAYMQTKETRTENGLQRGLQLLIAAIKGMLSENKPVGKVIESIRPMVFSTRTHTHIRVHDESKKAHMVAAAQKIAEISSRNKDRLNFWLTEVVELQAKVLNSLFVKVEKLESNPYASTSPVQIEPPSYEQLQLLRGQAGEHLDSVLAQFDISLDLEASAFLALLSNEGIIRIDRDELADQMRLTAEQYGATAVLNKVWEPEDEDEGQLVRNIKILVSMLRVQHGVEQVIAWNGSTGVDFEATYLND